MEGSEEDVEDEAVEEEEEEEEEVTEVDPGEGDVAALEAVLGPGR